MWETTVPNNHKSTWQKILLCKERLFIETASIFLERDAFYEERREREAFDKTLSTFERKTLFRNGLYSVSTKEGKVIKIKDKIVRLVKNNLYF